MASIDGSFLSHLRDGDHDLGRNVQKNKLTFALTVIGLIGMIVAAVGLTAFGVHQGWWSAGALTSISQVNAIRIMAAGGSVFLSGLVAIVLYSVCRKSHVEDMVDKIVDPSDSDMSEEDKALQTRLESWVTKGELDEKRSKASKRILDFVRNPGADTLDLTSLSLASLSDVFAMHKAFERLEELVLHTNKLMTLPDSISSLKALESLNLSKNQLKELPLGFGKLTNLHTLSLMGNKLKELPAGFGELTNLHDLDLSLNSLKALPAGFVGLTNLHDLDLFGNSLKELPDGFVELTNLHTLNLNWNLLEALPSSIGNLFCLESLNLKNNPSLISLPDEILFLPRGCEIDISGTGLSTQCLTTLRTAVSVEGYAGPRFSHAILENPLSVPDRPAKELLGIICEVTEHPSMEFEQLLGHEKKSTLELWLNKLSYIAELKKGPESQKTLLKSVITYLKLAEEKKSFREDFFNLIEEATGTCGDRMALSILQLGIAYQLNTIDLQDCKKVADFLVRGVWAIDILHEHAREKVKSLNFFDEIEVYLAYPIKLKETLKLPIPLEDMLYFRCSNVTDEDLEEARKDVEKAFADFDKKCHFLITVDKWKEALSLNHQEQVQLIENERAKNEDATAALAIYNDKLLELTKEALKNNS